MDNVEDNGKYLFLSMDKLVENGKHVLYLSMFKIVENMSSGNSRKVFVNRQTIRNISSHSACLYRDVSSNSVCVLGVCPLLRFRHSQLHSNTAFVQSVILT